MCALLGGHRAEGGDGRGAEVVRCGAGVSGGAEVRTELIGPQHLFEFSQ